MSAPISFASQDNQPTMLISQPPIRLRKMPQLSEAIDEHDNWTGVTDAAVRRKRQNRLNVRAYRRRQAQAQFQAKTQARPSLDSIPVPCWDGRQQRVITLHPSITKTLSTTHPLIPYTSTPVNLDRVIFPLSPDHLMTLLQFNVLRACLHNRSLLDHALALPPNTSSNEELHYFPTLSPTSLQSLPPSLHPTSLQLSTLHPKWIDIIPHPTLRNNLISALGTFDEDGLWSDTVGGIFEGFPASKIEECGVLMWWPPWDVSGWEVTQGFCRKWGWQLRGCEDLIEGSNTWRRRRGEEELVL